MYSYEGRLICSPKYSGIRTDSLNVNNIAVSSDTLVLVDSRDNRGNRSRKFSTFSRDYCSAHCN